jgi:short-subunit dehydrogenase
MKQIAVVAVVGGGGGLGSALVRQLLDQNYKLVVMGRTKPADARIQKFYPIDATQVDWRSFYATVQKENGGPCEAIIFVAGTAVFGKTAMIPLDRARGIFELNFWACASAARAAAEYWSQQDLQGKFLAILSIAARQAVPYEAYYSASKAAAARFLECLQIEYAHKGMQFICAFPGLLRTSFRDKAEWYGINTAHTTQGADVRNTSREIINLLIGGGKNRVIGWRERCVDLAGRLFPGFYDRVVLSKRARSQSG